jgi:hypothetical protein
MKPIFIKFMLVVAAVSPDFVLLVVLLFWLCGGVLW